VLKSASLFKFFIFNMIICGNNNLLSFTLHPFENLNYNDTGSRGKEFQKRRWRDSCFSDGENLRVNELKPNKSNDPMNSKSKP